MIFDKMIVCKLKRILFLKDHLTVHISNPSNRNLGIVWREETFHVYNRIFYRVEEMLSENKFSVVLRLRGLVLHVGWLVGSSFIFLF